jgi:hypothetical protein
MTPTHFTNDRQSGGVSRGTLVAGGLIVVGILAITVWPTLYRYDRMTVSGGSYPVRTNRFSGKTEMLSIGTGWFELKSSHQSTPTPAPTPSQNPVPTDELAKLDGRLNITTYKWIEADIYNGTSRALGNVRVEIVVSEESGAEAFRRVYELTSTGGDPLSSSRFIAECGFSCEKGQTYTWRIVSATWE